MLFKSIALFAATGASPRIAFAASPSSAHVPGCHPLWIRGNPYVSGSLVSAPQTVTTIHNNGTETATTLNKNWKCTSGSGSNPSLSHCPTYDPSIPIQAIAAWSDLGMCSISAPPPVNSVPPPPSRSTWSGVGCPDRTWVEGDYYDAGEMVELGGIVYQCTSAQFANFWCGLSSYRPGDSEFWETAWTMLGSCEGSMNPTTSPIFNQLEEIEGCGPKYNAAAIYQPGDQVVVFGSSDRGVVWECKKYPHWKYCNAGINFSPESEYNFLGWKSVGFCHGTKSPTSSPMEYPELKCRWYNGTKPVIIEEWSLEDLGSYTAGTRVRRHNEIFKCKGWPYSLFCKIAAYKPDLDIATFYNPAKQVYTYWGDAWERAGLCVDAFQPTTSPSTSPTSSPTSSPSETPVRRISVDASLQWNITFCDELRSNATSLLSLARVIEGSLYNGVNSQVSNGEVVESVLVYELCGEDVPDHDGYSPSRRLQLVESSDIGFSVIMSKHCFDCQEVMFTDTKEALESIVNDGSLVQDIRVSTDIGNDTSFKSGLLATFTTITESPTPTPTASPPPSESQVPSVDPGFYPSDIPSTALSHAPSESQIPSTNPSLSPSVSLGPTELHSMSPSTSMVPSASLGPTELHSNPPSTSMIPSDEPSHAPSSQPSSQPSPTPPPPEWVRVGSDIDGETAGDNSGYSVSLSDDGTRVAIGANNNNNFSGHVRVYDWDGSSWVQVGSDIDGEAACDHSGWSVSLSGDGTTVAIGAYKNDGNGSDSGHVRLYGWNGSSWVQTGSDIDGEAAGDNSGYSVSLSDDGTRVAIGASRNNGSNGSGSGHVRVYDWNGGSWVQVGSDIDGEAAQDYAGNSVSLSGDGTRVAIGGNFNWGSNGYQSGHVRVYDWDGSSWVQVGSDIDGEAVGDISGWSVSLSDDGTRVAIGAPRNDGNGGNSGHVRVYRLDGGSWVQVGSDIVGEKENDHFGHSVSLSDDGTRVAIGAYENDGNGTNAGHVRVYDLSGNSWVQVGADIDGEAAQDYAGYSGSVSLSNDGTSLAIGAHRNDGNGGDSGHVRVYRLI